MNTIYLDHNATTPLLPEVADAVARAYREGFGNPASQHTTGRRAHAVVEESREAIAAALGADLSRRGGDQLVFTSGGTEANHLAIFGATAARPTGRIAVSAIEHPSVLGPASILERQGWQMERLDADRSGVARVDPESLFADSIASNSKRERATADSIGGSFDATRRLTLVCLMLANHETGVVQPVAELAAAGRAAGVPLHTDATQAVGKLPIDFRQLGASTLAFAAHKFHGPIGIGGLLIRRGANIEPQFRGGFQQQGLRPGTEATPLILGLRAAIELYQRDAAARAAYLAALRDRFEAAVLAAYPAAVINGREAERLPHVSNIAFVGIDRQQLMIALDLAGVACSSGSACASGSSEPSHVLAAMGCEPEILQSSLRFSFGAENHLDEVDEATQRLTTILRQLGRSSP